MTPWVIVYAIGAAQAALLALALWWRPVNAQANRVLALWVAIVSFDLAVKALFLAAPTPTLLKVHHLVGLFPFLYSSLFYLYVRALTDGRGLAPRDIRHLAGFILMLAASLPLLLLDAERTQAVFERFLAGDRPRRPDWFDPLLFGHALAYLGAALLRVHRYRRELRQQRSDASRLSLRWIDTMAAFQLLIWGIATVHLLLRIPGIDHFLIYGAVAAWVCAVGWFSLAQPPVAELAAPAAGNDASVVEDDARFPEVEARLRMLMSEHALYREPALTIGQLARRSGYPEYLVSAVINRRFGGSFWDYINRQRIEAVRTCLADLSDTRSILDIAYACGFTSKSTFNAAFKRQVGATPSAYRRQQAASAGDASNLQTKG